MADAKFTPRELSAALLAMEGKYCGNQQYAELFKPKTQKMADLRTLVDNYAWNIFYYNIFFNFGQKLEDMETQLKKGVENLPVSFERQQVLAALYASINEQVASVISLSGSSHIPEEGSKAYLTLAKTLKPDMGAKFTGEMAEYFLGLLEKAVKSVRGV